MNEYQLPESESPKIPVAPFVIMVLLFACVIGGLIFMRRPAPDPEQYLTPVVEPDHSNQFGLMNSCEPEHDIPSTASDLQVQLLFRNMQNAAYEVYWVDFQGQHKHYATVEPGSQYTVQSYYGHRFAIYANGTCAMILTLGVHDMTLDMAPQSDKALQSAHNLQ